MNVSAKDLGTQKEQKITITAAGGLTKEEIEKMRKDAEAHAAEDEKRHAEVEERNKADSLAFQTEKVLKDAGDKIAAEKKAPVEAALKELKDALAKNAPIEEIKTKQEALTNAMAPVAQEMYLPHKVQTPRRAQVPRVVRGRLRRTMSRRRMTARRTAMMSWTPTSQ